MALMAYGVPFDTHCTERLLERNWRFDTHTKGIADGFLDNGNNSDNQILKVLSFQERFGC